MLEWQDWKVTGGAIARNKAGQIEGRLELRHENYLAFPGEYTLSFVFDASGAKWGWQPEEPQFITTREETED